MITLLVVVDVEFYVLRRKFEILCWLGVGTGKRNKRKVKIVVYLYVIPYFMCDSCGIIVGWKESSVGRCIW